jgi:cytochrome bd-type quinol oxidase subunit 2
MNVYKRMALGGALFGLIGPLIVGFGFGTLSALIVTFNDHHELQHIAFKWLSVSAFASVLAYYGGIVPAVFAGSLVGMISHRIRPPWFYFVSILSSLLICIIYFAKISDSGDTALLFGSVFSIPATAILGKCLLRIVYRSKIGVEPD